MANTAKTASSGAAFMYFGLLPAEVRIAIWEYRLKGDHKEVRVKFNYKMEFGRPTDVAIRNLSSAPALFHVNCEARDIAKEHYQLILGTKWYPAATYFNSKVRILDARHIWVP